MKVVLLHDWLVGYRGGERVLEALCELFPEAPIYTLIHKKGSTSQIIESRRIETSFLNKIPGIHSQYRKFLPFFPRAIESMKIDEPCDLMISSSHCVIKGLKKPHGAKHISYVHSPMRYLYDQYDAYFGDSAPVSYRLFGRFSRNYLTTWDKKSNANVDVMLANSEFVKNRIKNYYDLDAKVVHPFVELEDFLNLQKKDSQKKDFFLVLSAFAPNKRIDLAIEACKRMNQKLKIVGSGQDEKKLKNLAGPQTEFLGNLNRAEVLQYLSQAKALLFPGVEDFGIVPLESLAAGTAVIAYKAGGVLETLNNRTAVFFEEQTVEALMKAIKQFEDRTWVVKDLHEQASHFSKKKFKDEILRLIQS